MTIHLITVEIPFPTALATLQAAIAAALQPHGEPLRWAITTVDANRQTVWVEAVVTVA